MSRANKSSRKCLDEAKLSRAKSRQPKMSRAMPKGRAHMTAAANVRRANVECEDANVEGEESQPN